MPSIKIVTPEGTLYEASEVDGITLPTETGVITVLENHEPLITLLKPGIIIVDKDEEEPIEMAVSTGMVEIRQGSTINILADTAERAEAIDVERALEAKNRAEKLLQESEDKQADIDYAKLQSIIERETARIRAGNRYRKLNNVKPE